MVAQRTTDQVEETPEIKELTLSLPAHQIWLLQ